MEEEEIARMFNRLIESMICSAEASASLAQSINSLVESNQRLMMILVESCNDEDTPATTYMDGTPICQ